MVYLHITAAIELKGKAERHDDKMPRKGQVLIIVGFCAVWE